MKKNLFTILAIGALMLSLTACARTETMRDTREYSDPTPAATMMPDMNDGVVNDRDGIIEDQDTGTAPTPTSPMPNEKNKTENGKLTESAKP